MNVNYKIFDFHFYLYLVYDTLESHKNRKGARRLSLSKDFAKLFGSTLPSVGCILVVKNNN